MSDKTLKVTDEYLQGVVLQQIENFLTDLGSNTDVTTINNYAQFILGSTEAGGGPGLYNALMPGGDSFTEAAWLQSKFQDLCVDLQTALDTLQGQLTSMTIDLEMAQSLLQNGADDALTAAQMMEILNTVYQDPGYINSNVPVGSNSNVNTSSTNTNTNTNT
jgi:hypothetical protein